MGRPTKLSPEVHVKLLNLLRGGCARTVAVRACMVTEETFYRWMKRGKVLAEKGIRPTDPYRVFYEDVSRATAVFEGQLVQIVAASAFGFDKDGKRTREPSTSDAKWLLERKFPRRWMPRQEITKGGPPEVVEFVMNIPQPRVVSARITEAEKERILGTPVEATIEDGDVTSNGGTEGSDGTRQQRRITSHTEEHQEREEEGTGEGEGTGTGTHDDHTTDDDNNETSRDCKVTVQHLDSGSSERVDGSEDVCLRDTGTGSERGGSVGVGDGRHQAGDNASRDHHEGPFFVSTGEDVR